MAGKKKNKKNGNGSAAAAANDDLDAAENGGGIERLTPQTLKNLIKEASKAKAQASEVGGFHGKIVADACDKYGLMAQAFTDTRKMHDMGDDKRQAVLRQKIQLWEKMGWFDQIDAFDDLTALLNGIGTKASKRQSKDDDTSRALAH